VRAGFSGGITQCSFGELGPWSPAWFNQTIQLATHYGMWVTLDYHSCGDLVDGGCRLRWLSFRSGALSTNWSYSRIVRESIDEPVGSISVPSVAYQGWISQARVIGDTHWIVVENGQAAEDARFDPLSLVNCYPAVADPLNQTFLSILLRLVSE